MESIEESVELKSVELESVELESVELESVELEFVELESATDELVDVPLSDRVSTNSLESSVSFRLEASIQEDKPRRYTIKIVI